MTACSTRTNWPRRRNNVHRPAFIIDRRQGTDTLPTGACDNWDPYQDLRVAQVVRWRSVFHEGLGAGPGGVF